MDTGLQQYMIRFHLIFVSPNKKTQRKKSKSREICQLNLLKIVRDFLSEKIYETLTTIEW